METRGGGGGGEEGYRFARVLRVKTRYRIGCRRFPTPFSPHFPYTTPPPPTFNPARVSATRVVEEFFEASRLGSAKWIRLPPSGVASSGLPKRHSPLLTFRFAFSSPLFLSLPPRFSPLHLGVQQRYTMAAVIRCNGGERMGGWISLRANGWNVDMDWKGRSVGELIRENFLKVNNEYKRRRRRRMRG